MSIVSVGATTATTLLCLLTAGCSEQPRPGGRDAGVSHDAPPLTADGGRSIDDAGGPPVDDAGGPPHSPAPDDAAAAGPTADGGGLDGGGQSGPVNLFLNPFNKLSAHHRPVGAKAELGVPGGCHYSDYYKAAPVYDPPQAVGSRGRLDKVGLFRCGKSLQGRKWIYRVAPQDPQKTFSTLKSGKVTIRTPPSPPTYYPSVGSTGGDFSLMWWPRDGVPGGKLDLFYNCDHAAGTARMRISYGISGSDMADKSDPDAGGSSASNIRWPGTVLRGHEINGTHPGPIQHALNATATRHSRGASKAPASIHVLSRRVVWPAYGVDSSAKTSTQDNQGDLPYGTRIVLPGAAYSALKAKFAGKPRQLRILECLRYYGCYLIDGQGESVMVGGKQLAVLQLRVDGEVGKTKGGADLPKVVTEIDEALQAALPQLVPLRNPRPHNKETELWSDQLPYAGGGGPVDAHSVNSAWDAHP